MACSPMVKESRARAWRPHFVAGSSIHRGYRTPRATRTSFESPLLSLRLHLPITSTGRRNVQLAIILWCQLADSIPSIGKDQDGTSVL
jgi:hypothetical protein